MSVIQAKQSKLLQMQSSSHHCKSAECELARTSEKVGSARESGNERGLVLLTYCSACNVNTKKKHQSECQLLSPGPASSTDSPTCLVLDGAAWKAAQQFSDVHAG